MLICHRDPAFCAEGDSSGAREQATPRKSPALVFGLHALLRLDCELVFRLHALLHLDCKLLSRFDKLLLEDDDGLLLACLRLGDLDED